MNILIINGPNMSMLEKRDGYGGQSLDTIKCNLVSYANKRATLEFFTSSVEGEIVDKINKYSGYGIIINPAAFSHYSIAILDALLIFAGKKVEVHITNLSKREQLRNTSITAKGCDGYISGLGSYGYILALQYMLESINDISKA